jgi:hypothetical protein
VVNCTSDLPDTDLIDNAHHTIDNTCTQRAAIIQANFDTILGMIALPTDTYTLTRPGVDDRGLVGDPCINAPSIQDAL